MPAPKRKKKAEAIIVQLRVLELVRLRLRGAQFWDVREYIAEKEVEEGSPWKLPPRAKPMSERQIRNYVRRADTIVQRSGRIKGSVAISQHFARREHLYAEAVLTGDLRTALACLQDSARLKGLYPAEKKEVEHKGELRINKVIVNAPVHAGNNGAAARGAGGVLPE